MKIIKNSNLFSQDYVPETVVGRGEYIERLKDLIRGSEVSSTFVVRGNPGTGKTLIGKYLLKELKEFRGAYVNCYVNQSDRSIVSIILNDPGVRYPDSGIMRGESLSSILLNGLSKKNNLIVLDEAHSLKRSHGQIVYLLSRSKELGGPEVKLVLLSMEEPEMFLDRSTLSGLGRYNRFSLKEYDANDLREILGLRAKIGFYDGSYTDSAINRASELAEESGSARIAIELLRNSALYAESKNLFLDEDSVLQAYRDFSPPLEDSSLINLDKEEVLLLRQLMELMGVKGRFKSSDLKSLNNSLNESRIYKFLKTIELSGLVKKSKIGKGYGGGVENEYVLRVSPQVLLGKLSLIERTFEPPERHQ
jgi:Cdc6-like AAA superfamily ATPase